MSVICRESGISRKTGYKILSGYKDSGVRGLEAQARSSYRHPNKKPCTTLWEWCRVSSIIYDRYQLDGSVA